MIARRVAKRHTGLILCLAGMAALGAVGVARAYFPREPIALPLYSFDVESPSTHDQQPAIDADALLERGPTGNDQPSIRLRGENLGLGRPQDDLDGFSFNRAAIAKTREWVFLFSVARGASGDTPPDPALVATNVVYNVTDQARRGHASGDGYISLADFNSNGPTLQLRGTTKGNTLAINNYDEGGQGLQGVPPVSSSAYTGTVAEDNVDAMAEEANASPARKGVTSPPGIYFTVTANSPSLWFGFLPGDSGADVFYDPAPDVLGLQQSFPFASAAQLGLTALDEIDALLVSDGNSNGVFDGADEVWFSLTPESPSLDFFPNASMNAGADIFVSRVGPGGIPQVGLFATADDLGLLGPGDDVDALDIVPCGDQNNPCQPILFGVRSGMRLIPGDWNNDGIINEVDVPNFVTCLSGPAEGVDFVPPGPLCRDIFDLNRDEDVDLADFMRFTAIFGSGPPPN